MTFIADREARFFNFKTKECYPADILKHPNAWKLIFNGEDWSARRVFYASEGKGIVIAYAVDEKGKYCMTKDKEEVLEEDPKKGRVRILKIGDEIDTVENIWNIKGELDETT